MYLQKLSLVNFKNFDSKTFEFEEKINCFVGQNGIGKTNILDAIYYLSFAKSYFNPVAVQNIQHHKAFFVVEGDYSINDRKEKIICSLKKGQKKILKRNGKAYEKFSDHVGQVPLVIISPSDRDMVTDGSDSRRKFIDGVISQQDKSYLKGLIAYNKVLSQRNALLKYFAANRTFDAINLEVYDDQLIAFGSAIFKKRKEFLEQFIPIFNHKYQIISNENEEVNLIYKSQLLSSTYKDLLKNSLGKDKMLQYTTVGIHKDDLSFEIGDYPIKKFGSQGQQKSYLIALKFAQFEFIKQQSNLIPILLLDDIFDKLDESRVSQIIELVDNDEFGQIFITDTHSDRIKNIIQRSNKSYQIFKI
ncbi:MAG: DNA replication and repair protein RecF [Flavobacteriaceae bacterium]|jgi:DNA replication and repair protein RecF|tara:strand:+ start:1066 stop:2145 length:1080 start_codon:yes stop_codon:yes gene_type:complete